jgi:DNA modification methylase
MLYDTMVFFGANYYTRHLPIGGWICWDKRTKDELDDMFGSPFELAWFRTNNTAKKSIMIRVLHGGMVNADLKYFKDDTRLHPTQKPIILFEEIIRKLTKEGDVVFDPFCGSGTTLLAAENTGRNCIAFEIEPMYCNVILSRFKELTNIEPCKG